MPTTTQWVNLTKDAKWSENGETTAVMGEVEVRLTFQNAARADVKYQLLPQSGNAVYTSAEKDAHDAFRTDESVHVTQTGADGTVTVRVPLPAAGGGKFKVKGWKPGFLGYKGQSQTSDEFLAARRIFYRFAAMPNVPALSLPDVEAAYWDVDKKLHVQLVKMGATVALADAPMFYGTAEAYALRDEIERGVSLGNRHGLGLTIALVHRVGTQKDQTIHQAITQAIPSESQALANLTVRLQAVGPLFAPAADQHKTWFRTGKYVYEDLDDQRQEITIRRDDVVKVDATTVDVTLRAKDLRRVQRADADNPLAIAVSLSLQAVAETSGAAFPQIGLTVLATEKEAGVFGTSRIKMAAIHEIGHIFGMAPEPGDALTSPPDYYVQQNHQGPHCGKGATFTAAEEVGQPGTWSGTPGCVMFGAALRDLTSGPETPATYCSDCEKLVRKVDLSSLT